MIDKPPQRDKEPTWKGKVIDESWTKQELINAIAYLIRSMDKMHHQHMEDLDILGGRSK
jgi:primase-polymerase (primpol)-like protein